MAKLMPAMLNLAIFTWILSMTEGKHWPDFSCLLPVKESTLQKKTVRHYKMGWESCKDSFERTKQECDKMCILINRQIIKRSKKTDPFDFVVDTFIAIMLQEMGYEEENIEEAPQGLVRNVTAPLQVCKTKHREYETMKNFHNLPCEPYNGLFECVDKAVGCPV